MEEAAGASGQARLAAAVADVAELAAGCEAALAGVAARRAGRCCWAVGRLQARWRGRRERAAQLQRLEDEMRWLEQKFVRRANE